jgi:hypothetical protein
METAMNVDTLRGKVKTYTGHRTTDVIPGLQTYEKKILKTLLSLCKIWGFYGSDYEEWRPLGFKNPVHTSQETHYVSTTEPNQLMLCKIWGFYSSDYEEWRPLGFKNPVRTSQETHYVSTTKPNQLMLCKIWGFYGSDYEEWRPLGFKTQFVLHRRHITSPLQSLTS